MLVTTSLIIGGAENQVYLLAKEFRKEGHEVSIVSLTDPGAYVEELEGLGIEVVGLGMKHAASDVAAFPRLVRLVRQWRPDVVHAHMFHAILLARLARIGVRMPVLVSTTHNFSPESWSRRMFYRFTDRLSTITTNVSEAGTAAYIEAKAAPPGRIIAFPNGIAIPDRHNGPLRAQKRQELELDDGFAWLAVGRLEEPKDYPTMLRALQVLVNAGSRSTFLIAGHGSEAGKVERIFAGMSELHGQVRFLGVRSDVPDLMDACDGYVMSSSSEGLPLVLLEASAASLPIVATDVGGNKEIVAHGVNGYVVPAQDPEALAKSMRDLETLPLDDRRRMGANGRRHVEEFYEIGAVAKKWLDHYQRWLG